MRQVHFCGFLAEFFLQKQVPGDKISSQKEKKAPNCATKKLYFQTYS